MPALRDTIVHRLREIGVRALFGMPGGGANLDLIDAAGRADLPFVLTATETGGALAAIAQAEVTQQPGACLTTLGPGAASVANGVACAFLDRAPLLVFTDSHASSSNRAFEHQQFDHQAFFRPITKWSGRLTPGCASTTIEAALAAVLDVPPGPVHVDCPEDFESAAPLPGSRAQYQSRLDTPRPTPSAQRPTPNAESILSSSRRPLVIVGLGARRSEDAVAIRGLIERRGIPAMVTYKAKGVVPDDHPCFAGVFTNARVEQSFVASSDLILGIGLDPVELLPRPWPYSQPAVYIGRWDVADTQVPFAAQYVKDVPAGVAEIDASLATCAWVGSEAGPPTRSARSGQKLLTPEAVVQITAERLARSARVTVDAGAHMFPATMLWPVYEPNQMLISNGLSTMGFALPAAIGAALTDRDRPVVALTGDGGLLICAAELLTAVREKLRIIVIVFSDASLSLIEIKQQRRRYQPAGVALGPVKWPALAESLGAAGFVATNEAELEAALDQAIGVNGPSLVEARIDPSDYGSMLEAIRG